MDVKFEVSVFNNQYGRRVSRHSRFLTDAANSMYEFLKSNPTPTTIVETGYSCQLWVIEGVGAIRRCRHFIYGSDGRITASTEHSSSQDAVDEVWNTHDTAGSYLVALASVFWACQFPYLHVKQFYLEAHFKYIGFRASCSHGKKYICEIYNFSS